MAIKVNAELIPYGIGLAGRHHLANIHIASTLDGRHVYTITCGEHTIEGYLPKTRSGHQNILHLMRAVLSDRQIDELPQDYAPSPRTDKSCVCGADMRAGLSLVKFLAAIRDAPATPYVGDHAIAFP